MIEAIGTGLTSIISWVGQVVDALVTTEGELAALLPLFAIGVAASALFLAIKGIKSLIWGA